MLADSVRTVCEQRRYPRVAYDRQVSVRVSEWSTLAAHGHDISRGGIRLALSARVDVGDHVSVGLILPNGLQMSLVAKVRYVLPGADAAECIVGLEWIPTNVDDLMLLRDLVGDLDTSPPTAD